MTKADLIARVEVLEMYLETGDESILHEVSPFYSFQDIIEDAEEGLL